MTARRYRLLVDLYYPTNPDTIRRIAHGENVPWQQRRNKQARAGEIVTDLPSVSIAGLLAKGAIEAVTETEEADGDQTE